MHDGSLPVEGVEFEHKNKEKGSLSIIYWFCNLNSPFLKQFCLYLFLVLVHQIQQHEKSRQHAVLSPNMPFLEWCGGEFWKLTIPIKLGTKGYAGKLGGKNKKASF